jgi:hypothetical protein
MVQHRPTRPWFISSQDNPAPLYVTISSHYPHPLTLTPQNSSSHSAWPRRRQSSPKICKQTTHDPPHLSLPFLLHRASLQCSYLTVPFACLILTQASTTTDTEAVVLIANAQICISASFSINPHLDEIAVVRRFASSGLRRRGRPPGEPLCPARAARVSSLVFLVGGRRRGWAIDLI